MSSNTQVEFNAIKFIMESQRPELLVSVVPEYFGNVELMKIFMLIRKFYVDNSTFMGWDLLRGYVSKSCKTADKTKFMLSILDQIQNRDIQGLTEELLISELKDYRKFRLVLDKVTPLVSAVEDKDIDATLGRLKELHDSVFVEQAISTLNSADMASMVYEDVEFKFRSTGIPPIDERGGLILGGYTIIAAPKKTGKSALSCMIATHQYIHENTSVAYFTYEMGASEIRARMMANVANLDLGDIMDRTLSAPDTLKLWRAEADFMWDIPEDAHIPDSSRKDYFEYVNKNFPRKDKEFLIIDTRPDWDTLWAQANLLATTRNVGTFVIDYPYLVKRPANGEGKQLQQWEYALLQSRNIKAFAYKHQVCVITPAQLDSGKKGEEPKLRFVTNAEQDCDLSLYMMNTDEDKTLGTTSIKWGVCRNFKSIQGKPYLEDFKLLRELNKGRFTYLEY